MVHTEQEEAADLKKLGGGLTLQRARLWLVETPGQHVVDLAAASGLGLRRRSLAAHIVAQP